jgi:hypothetical protein
MKKIVTLSATAVFLCSSAVGYAAQRGASQISPGHEMRSSGSHGASRFAPGHEMKQSSHRSGPGASEFSPGDRMNDARHR